MIRLDKYLATMGAGTRSEIKKKIRQGMVTVDDLVCKVAETKVDETCAQIALGGKIISYQQFEYYMFSKPAGCVSATEDHHDRTVMDYIDSPQKKKLFPVGRLDKDTEGLLLITNDGDLAHRLLSPSKQVDKVYYAKVAGALSEAVINVFKEGVYIGKEERTLPAQLEICRFDEANQESEIRLTIQEGKFHQVKRMFEAVDCKVVYLKRLSMGTLILDDSLKPGEYRPLTEEELKALC